MGPSNRFIVGIDLGTTNCALAYAKVPAPEEGVSETLPDITQFPLPQLVHPGEVQTLPLLPSFHYTPAENELPAGATSLPWDEQHGYVVGQLARNLGEKIHRRMIASAKSWLCHQGIDRTAAVLPWGVEADVAKISPLEATTRYLRHLRDAWNHEVAQGNESDLLEHQEIYLTVPASFDAIARDLTMQAATAAGLEQVTLLEEPQAAFYSWLFREGNAWRESAQVGDTILVCDIGGGTTDFTLIGVSQEEGNLTLERLAVGDHILLGGDNMDLALAQFVRAKLMKEGHRLDLGQTLALGHACRVAKERLFADAALDRLPITVVGRGSKLIGGTIQTELSRTEVEQVIVDGFFAACGPDERPAVKATTGLQELGLPYASDPVLSRHVAAFLARQSTDGEPLRPTAILFNGGVLKADPIRHRLIEVINGWFAGADEPIHVLPGFDLDLAVARGATYYGLVRRGKGIRIRGGTPRSYYVAIETSMPAIPGMPPPTKALCVVPFNLEEGSEVEVPGQEFALVVGQPVHFRFLSSTQRHDDTVGTMIEDWEFEGIEELSPIETTLEAPGEEGSRLPVHLRGKVTEVGTLELWCVARDDARQWKLEFNVREAPVESAAV